MMVWGQIYILPKYMTKERHKFRSDSKGRKERVHLLIRGATKSYCKEHGLREEKTLANLSTMVNGVLGSVIL